MKRSANVLSANKIFGHACAVLVSLLSGLAGPSAHAQMEPSESPTSTLQWQAGLGYNHYLEPAIRLQGPEVGLGMRWSPNPTLRLEGQWWGGRQRYDSDMTGSLDGVANHEFRAMTLYRLGHDGSWLRNYQLGLAGHFVYNDLRGQTSNNARGYERISEQVWLPLRWQSSRAIPLLNTSYLMEYEMAWLLLGRQTSRLSQANVAYSDVRNTQKKGLYLQMTAVASTSEAHVAPFIRLTRIHRSDSQILNFGQQVHEPSNTRIQVGVNWVW